MADAEATDVFDAEFSLSHLKKRTIGRLMTFIKKNPRAELLEFLHSRTQRREVVSKTSHVYLESLIEKNKRGDHIKLVFTRVHEILRQKIDLLVVNDIQKKEIFEHLDKITFAGLDCHKDVSESQRLAHVFDINAFYNPEDKTFKYCLGLLSNSTSEFPMVFTIAHELTHSFDPCNLAPPDFVTRTGFTYQWANTREGYEAQYPFASVVTCLRSQNSINARDQQEDASKNNLSLGSFLKEKPAGTEHLFCSDQITESLADWMAAEILPEYMKKYHADLSTAQLRRGFANVWREFGCQSRQSFDVHPQTKDRIDRILAVQPLIRQMMRCDSCPPPALYCAFH